MCGGSGELSTISQSSEVGAPNTRLQEKDCFVENADATTCVFHNMKLPSHILKLSPMLEQASASAAPRHRAPCLALVIANALVRRCSRHGPVLRCLPVPTHRQQ